MTELRRLSPRNELGPAQGQKAQIVKDLVKFKFN